MADVKLTKNELRAQQTRLKQLLKYLPTLQLKKAMLQAEVNDVRQEISQLEQEYKSEREVVDSYSSLLSEKTLVDPKEAVEVVEVKKRWENIAGVEIPYFEEVVFQKIHYSLVDTPPWVDAALEGLRKIAIARVKIDVAKEKKEALERELREVSIRVNLFEKILIPRAKANIKKIRVFLGDQELSAVSQAKVAKTKIETKKAMKREEEMAGDR